MALEEVLGELPGLCLFLLIWLGLSKPDQERRVFGTSS
jgi:hypothetical protein